MKERPILMQGEMVRALIDGSKNQTRRVVKAQPDAPVTDAIPRRDYPHGPPTVEWYWRPKFGHRQSAPSAGWDFKCPYGQPGDRLWVRETHAIVPRTAYAQSEGVEQVLRPDDDHDAAVFREGWERSKPGRWRPSIHMPRWASRITLEITGVRVERLQEISEVDAEAEGVLSCADSLDPYGAGYMPSELFSILWVSINGHESWHANPWVWVVKFRRLESSQVAA